jgi:hypothetical protein
VLVVPDERPREDDGNTNEDGERNPTTRDDALEMEIVKMAGACS